MTSVEREVFAREEARELKERVIEINRVAKVVKGGRRFSFTALVVIGDEVDRVGVGYGKAREVPLAITKAVDDAKKNLFTVPKHGTTITHEILGRSELNDIEVVWGDLKAHHLAHQTFTDPDILDASIHHAVATLNSERNRDPLANQRISA